MLMPIRQPALVRWLPDRLCPWLAALLILSAAASHVIYLAQGGPLDLAPDEAHYWDWSRHLDWSYYSKGPLVAWLIRASCELLGPWSERVTGSLTFAIRLPAVICGSLLLTSLYVLTVQVYGRPRLALALVAAGLTMPLVAAGSILMTIDSPYTCCWGWALVFTHRAVTRSSGWAWVATGVVTGLGILAKYTMVVFPASLALYLLTSREHRRLLLSPGFWSMAGLAALFCVPILIWNMQHGWVTFLHVFRLAGIHIGGDVPLRSGGGLRWLGPLHYFAAQAGLLLGYWFLVWVTAMVAWNPLREKDIGTRLLWWMSAPMFVLFLAFSLKTGGGEPNWPVTTYLSGGVLAAAWLSRQLVSPSWTYRATTAFGVTVTLLVGLGLTLMLHRSSYAHALIAKIAGPPTEAKPFPIRRFDPTCRLRGWRHLGSRLDVVVGELREKGLEPILAGINWSLPGALGVYCAGHPQAYSIGLAQGDRRSQYDFWTNPFDHQEEFLGRTFVVVGPMHPTLETAFERVEPAIDVVYEENGQPLAGWKLRVCHGFNGFAPRGQKPSH